jgi:hypothetical protein
VTIFSNTNDHCSGSLHYAKSTLEKLENDVATVGSTREFGVLHPFLEKQLDIILYNEGEENEGPSFILSRKSVESIDVLGGYNLLCLLGSLSSFQPSPRACH